MIWSGCDKKKPHHNDVCNSSGSSTKRKETNYQNKTNDFIFIASLCWNGAKVNENERRKWSECRMMAQNGMEMIPFCVSMRIVFIFVEVRPRSIWCMWFDFWLITATPPSSVCLCGAQSLVVSCIIVLNAALNIQSNLRR